MAKGRVGGTKSKLRGVVGDVIYQIAKNPYGDYDQKIISYTKEKLNNNTKWQALARMQIAMFQRCMSLLTPIIRESYQGIKTGVTSINYFVKINMALVQEDCIDNWTSPKGFSYPQKGKVETSSGLFCISQGTYKMPSIFSVKNGRFPEYNVTYCFDLSKIGRRMYDLRKQFRFSYNDTLNLIIWGTNSFGMAQDILLIGLQFNRQFGDYTMINQSNCGRVFSFTTKWWGRSTSRQWEVRLNASFDNATGILSIKPALYIMGLYDWIEQNTTLFTYIASHKKGTVWERNVAWFQVPFQMTPDDEWGVAPFEWFNTWDPNYDGEPYDEYF